MRKTIIFLVIFFSLFCVKNVLATSNCDNNNVLLPCHLVDQLTNHDADNYIHTSGVNTTGGRVDFFYDSQMCPADNTTTPGDITIYHQMGANDNCGWSAGNSTGQFSGGFSTVYIPVTSVLSWQGTESSTFNENGIATQFTPVSGSSVGYNVNFTGTYNNSAGYNQICAFFTTTDEDVLPHCSPLPTVNGFGLPYNFNYSLDPNHTFSYTLKLYDGVNYTSARSPISFSTSALSTTATPAWVPEACDWTSPATYGGCISNIFYSLFFPSLDSLNQFQTLSTLYVNKPPFGYIVAVQNTLKNINDTGTSAFTLTSMPILNTFIFDPLRTALVWVLWVAFLFVLYHRLSDIIL